MTKMKRVVADSDMKLFRSLKVKKAQRVQERQRKREREGKRERERERQRKREREWDRRKCQVPGEVGVFIDSSIGVPLSVSFEGLLHIFILVYVIFSLLIFYSPKLLISLSSYDESDTHIIII